MGGKISVMIDIDLWDLVRDKICNSKENIHDDSEKIDTLINNILWDYFSPPEH